MEVEIDLRGGRPEARLVNPTDFGGFAVVLLEDRQPLGSLLSPIGVARFDEYAWISVAELERLAGDAATPEWRTSFDGMLEFARSRGWVDDELAAVRGHVERR